MSDVTVKFSAEDQNLSKTVTSIQKDLARLDAKSKDASKGFDLSFGKIGLAAGVAGAAVKAGMMAVEGATAAARAVVDGFGQAIDLGGQLTDLSSRTGETAGNLLLLQRAFENSGVGAEKVGTSINKLQKFMAEAAAGGASQTATLDALGISMADLAGKTPTEQMQVLAQKIGSISDPAERARVAMTVFGKSGGELLPLLNNFAGEIEGAKGQLGSMPELMNRSAKALDDLGDKLFGAKSKTREFAAGFLEAALPSLNAFVSALSGVDAAGWGQALMKQVMSVADFLIGAFKAPMPAIEAIGAALNAGIRIAGNNYLNSLIDAGKFLSAFFSSDLPGLISGVMGNTLIKTFVDGAKALIDGVNSVVKAFETWLGAAVSNVVDFFSSKFSAVLNAVAQDFQAAMSDPIGFVTGKLDNALAAVMQNGGNTFQTSFDKAGGSALDKISAGLGAVSQEYGDKIVEGSSRARGEFDKLVAGIEPSAKDFFGAKSASEEAVKKFGEVESVGTKLRQDFEKSADASADAQDNVSSAVTDAEAIAGSFNKAEGSTKKIKEELSQSAKLLKDISDAEAKDAADKGGRLQKKAQEQIDRGDFGGARDTARKIATAEEDAAIRGTGKNRDRRDLSDIGRDYGLRKQLGENDSDFRRRIQDAREGNSYGDKFGRNQPFDDPGKKDRTRTPQVDKPGQDGRTGPDKGPDKTGQSPLEKLVNDIFKLVEKIEPRLPVAALTA